MSDTQVLELARYLLVFGVFESQQIAKFAPFSLFEIMEPDNDIGALSGSLRALSSVAHTCPAIIREQEDVVLVEVRCLGGRVRAVC
jgi:hypothetical protein